MAELSWAQQATDNFFKCREFPTQSQCDDNARMISGGPAVQPVDVPGSLSYTVLCTGRPNKQCDLIVSFRESESMIDRDVVTLAKSIHGALVPEATYHGNLSGANPPLHIYSMPYLRGVACLEVLSSQVELNPEEEARHICYIKHLARYFARGLSKPQYVETQVQTQCQEEVYRRLTKLKDSSCILPRITISELENSLPILFSPKYPQILTHSDLSQTNILVDEKTCEILGIVDWSLAKVLPFGMELDSLFLVTGYMDPSGWNSYTCRLQLLNAFWDEFWAQSRIDNDVRRQELYTLAMQAARIGAVLHHAFQRNADGSPSEELTTNKWALKWLNASLIDGEAQSMDR